ncbi:MAG: four helix bundle protein [Verrucomicrobia bacterium]|nr:four helix bundle protein [Verrucomicrobiota bacterium]
MAKYRSFDELPVWKEAARLYHAVLDLLEEHGSCFSTGFRNQLDRAALSVSNNIAEGFERATTGGLAALLDIARGSAGEVRSMMLVIETRPRAEPARSAIAAVKIPAEACIRQLTGWLNQIESGPIQGPRHVRPVRTANARTDKPRRPLH